MVAESIMEHTTTEESTMVIKMGMCCVFCHVISLIGRGESILKYQYIDTDAVIKSIDTQIKNINTKVFI